MKLTSLDHEKDCAADPTDFATLLANTDSDAQLTVAGREWLGLALPKHRERVLSDCSLLFQSLCRTYGLTALMLESFRREVPPRWELLQEYENSLREIETAAVAMLYGEAVTACASATTVVISSTNPSGLIETKESDLGFQFLRAYATIWHAHRYHV